MKIMEKKSCIPETPNLSTDADSSTDIFVSVSVKKVADSKPPKGLLSKKTARPPFGGGKRERGGGAGVASNSEHFPVFRAPCKGGLGLSKNVDSVTDKKNCMARGQQHTPNIKHHTMDGHRDY